MKPLLSYLVVRRDLSHAQQVVQVAHAAMIMGWNLHRPIEEPVHVAALGVINQDELMAVVKDLERGGCQYELFHEPDHNVGYTAICTYPSTIRNNRLSKLPLL